MEIKVFDRDLTYIGIIDNYISAQTIKNYYDKGTFTFSVPFTIYNFNLLEVDNLVVLDEFVGFIHSRQVLQNEEETDVLLINGYDMKMYLKRRLQASTYNHYGTMTSFCEKMIVDNLMCSGARNMPTVMIGNHRTIKDPVIRKQVSNTLVYNTISEVVKTNECSFDFETDFKEKKHKFYVIEGIDHSITSTEPIVFSKQFDNILSEDYAYSKINYLTFMRVGGEGEGSNRIFNEVDLGATGFDRYEGFVDKKDIRKESLTDSEYLSVLKQVGLEELSNYKITETLSATINKLLDCSLGDIVTVVDRELKLQMDVRITSIEKIYESGNITVNYSIGEDIGKRK